MRIYQKPDEINCVSILRVCRGIIDQKLHSSGIQQWKIFRKEIDRNQFSNRAGLIESVQHLLEAGNASAIQAHLEMRVEGWRLEIVDKNLEEHRVDLWRQSTHSEYDGLRHGFQAAFARGTIRQSLTRTQNAAGIAVASERALVEIRWCHGRTQQHSIGAIG